jgi:ubiquinol oxidase
MGENSKYEYTMGKEMDLKAEQEKTLQTPVMQANIILRMMYLTMDLLYGKQRTLPKFKVIEILASYPYRAWENGSYNRVSRRYARARFTKPEPLEHDLRHIELGRHAQDNEQTHLILIEDIMRQKKMPQSWFKGFLLPRCMMLNYHILTRIMYYFKPEWSFSMNARFESHAEHEYMRMVQEHPEWEEEPVDSVHFEHYPRQKTMADLFRRIGLDERDHMNESKEEYERLTGRSLDQE